jgi:hypothetical protein
MNVALKIINPFKMNLPLEIQMETLLKLSPRDILSYCQTHTDAQRIWQDPYFWTRKAEHDFGMSSEVICQMSPYWQYRFMQSVANDIVMVGPLVRAGKLDTAQELAELDPFQAARVAILNEDLVTLQFLAPYLKMWSETGGYYKLLTFAFIVGFKPIVDYILSFEPAIVVDAIILEDLLIELREHDSNEGIALLHPYIIESFQEFPEGITEDLTVLREYIEDIL